MPPIPSEQNPNRARTLTEEPSVLTNHDPFDPLGSHEFPEPAFQHVAGVEDDDSDVLMSPLISVITATQVGRTDFLSETAESVLGQVLPRGWSWEWVIQCDNQSADDVRLVLPADSRIKVQASGEHLGRAATRNLALSRAKGSLIQALDDDDLLLPGALETHLWGFLEDHRVVWSSGQADDLMDGVRIPFDSRIPTHFVAPGAVNDDALLHGDWGINCAGVMYRAKTLRAVGGWAALPFDTATSLFAAVSESGYGWLSPNTTWLYRRHAGQSTQSPAAQWGNRGREIALQRVRAMRAEGRR